jgi:integrase
MALATSHNLKYITSFKDRHGKRRFYFRYHHQKFKLPGKPGDAAFHDTYARYLAAAESGALGRNNVVFINGTIGWVIEKYLSHEHGLLKHAASTQRNYRLFCDIIKREIGQFKIADLTPVAVRAMRDSISLKHKPSVADLCVSVVSTLWQYAIEHERMPLGHNPAKGIFKLHKKKRITKRWSQEIIDKFSLAATPSMRLGLYLLLYTAQRESDVVTMQWDHIQWDAKANCNVIRVKQRKTGEVVWIPILPALQAALDQTPRINSYILNSERGTPFVDASSLSGAIRRTLKEIDVEDHSGHGLRVSAACALKEAGCSDDLVAAITGHTNMKTLRIYLKEVDRQQMAREAAAKRTAAGRG